MASRRRRAETRSRKKRDEPADPQQRGRGRPSKFTSVVRTAVLNAVRAGNYLETCAAYAGISYDTLNEWVKRGDAISRSLPGEEEAFAKAAAQLDLIEREYLEFSEAVKSERARAEMQALLEIQQAAKGSQGRGPIWQAHAWFLERSYPDRWGRRVVSKEISGPKGGPIPIEDLSPISDGERMERLRKLLGTAATA